MGGSALCGAAPNMNAMIVGRAIAGAGVSQCHLGYKANTISITNNIPGKWYVFWSLDATVRQYDRV
jgi:MFS family permease